MNRSLHMRSVSKLFRLVSLFVVILHIFPKLCAQAGTVRGGQLPIVGSHTYLFAASTNAKAPFPISLLHGTGVTVDSSGNGYVVTDSNGNFNLTGLYASYCPTFASSVYILGVGGDAGYGSNASIVIAVAMPVSCGSLSNVPSINVNELTTAAAAWALHSYATVGTDGFSSNAANAQAMASAFVYAHTLVNSYTGAVSATEPYAKINTLADMLATCVNQSVAGPCTQLFTDATPASGTSPVDTIQAAIDIVSHPNHNVAKLFKLLPPAPSAVFTPTLAAAPPDWNLLPAITWAAPATIVYGTALSANQLDATSIVPGTFVYTPEQGSILNAGSQTLSLAFTPSDLTAYAANTASVNLTVGQAAQNISFAAVRSSVALGSSPIALSAVGGGSGNPVVFTIVSGPGTIVGNTLTVTGVGTIVIAANQAGNSNYAAATEVAQSVVAEQASQTITFTAVASPITFGASPMTLFATGGGSGNPIVFRVVSGPGAVTGNVLTITGGGTVVVAADQAGNASYAAAEEVTQSIVVALAPQAITFSAPASPVLFGILPITLSATGGASGNIVSFEVLSGPGAIYGNTLEITGVGTIVVAANQAGNTNYAAAPQVTQSIVADAGSQTSLTSVPSPNAFLKYKVMGVVYAPPGSASSVTYGNSNLVGSTDTMSFTNSSTQTTSLSVSVSAGIPHIFGSTATYSYSDGWTDSIQRTNSVSVQTTTGNSVATMGPISSSLGVDHDNDVIYIWLNPVLTGTTAISGSTASLNWTALQSNSCDRNDPADPPNLQQAVGGCDPNQYPYPDIIGIPVWCLKNPYSPNQGCAQWIAYTSRSWDLSTWGKDSNTQLPLGPGLTMRDYADILEADPFVVLNGNATNVCHPSYGPHLDPNVPETVPQLPQTLAGNEVNYIDPLGPLDVPAYLYTPVACKTANTTSTMYRFQPYGAVEYPVPGPNGLPSTYSGNFQYSQTNTSSNVATDSHTVSQSTSIGASATGGADGTTFFFGASVSAGTSNSTTWQQESGASNTTGSTATASYSITGPQLSDNYVGPATYNVYLDNVYGTFAFYSDVQYTVAPTALGTINISIPSASGVSTACVANAASPCYAFPGTVTTQTAAQWTLSGYGSNIRTVSLTNTSVYPMTMAGPAVTFSDPGFQVVENDGSDTCSSVQLIAGQTCTLHIAFAPVLSDAPNLINGNSYPVIADLVAAGTVNVTTVGAYQNILVTNYGLVSGIASPGAIQTGATLLPVTEDTNVPNAYIFPASSEAVQTEQFVFRNYSSMSVTFAGYPNDIALTDAADFSILNASGATDGCSAATVQPGGTCVFTLQFLPATSILQTQTYNTQITAVANGQPLAFAGATGTIPLSISVTSNPTGSGQITIPYLNTRYDSVYIYDWAVPITITNNSNATVTFNQDTTPTNVGDTSNCEADAGTGANGYFSPCIGYASITSSTPYSMAAGDGYIFGQLSGTITPTNSEQPYDKTSFACIPGLPASAQQPSNSAPPGCVQLTCGTTLGPQSSCTAATVAYITQNNPVWEGNQGGGEVNTFTANYNLPLSGTFSINSTTQPFTVNVPVVVNGENCDSSGCPGYAALIQVAGAEQRSLVAVPAKTATASLTITPTNTTASSRGTLSVHVGSLTASVPYAAGTTTSAVIQALVTSLNAKGSPVKAISAGNVISLTSATAGTAGNVALTSVGDSKFAIKASGMALTGGANATSTMQYDTGTIQVTTNGLIASAVWGSSSTPATVAQNLASSINQVAGAYWIASATEGYVLIKAVSSSRTAHAATEAVSTGSTKPANTMGITVTQTGKLTPSSFSAVQLW